MADLVQIKEAVCQAIDRRSQAVAGAKSVRVDMKFNDDGSLCRVAMFAEYEFTVRGGRKAGIERYEMNS